MLLKDTEDSKKTLEEELQKTAEVKPADDTLAVADPKHYKFGIRVLK